MADSSLSSVRSALRRPLTVAAAVSLILSPCLSAVTFAAGVPTGQAARTTRHRRSAARKSVSNEPNALQEIKIMAQRTSQAVARLAQKQAMNIINIETYNKIKQLPDVTTAEALERIPGVSRETDEGEARYVTIRGLDPDLNSTTFDGVELLPTNNQSAFGGYRAVELDLIPIGLVGAITVTDTNLPSQSAEALGGTVNITPKTAPSSGKAFLEGRLGGGYEPLRSTPIIDVQVTGGTRFGGSGTPAGGVSAFSDDPFSVVGTLVYYEDHRGINDVEPGYIDANTRPDPLYWALTEIQQRHYQLHRKRLGAGLSLGYQPDANDKYYLRAFQTGYTEDYSRPFFDLLPDGNPTVNAGGRIVDTLNNPGAINMSYEHSKEVDKENVYMFSGENLFSGGQDLTYKLAYVKASVHYPFNYTPAFSYTPALSNATITYSPTGQRNTPLYTISGVPGLLDPANYNLSSDYNFRSYNYDQQWSAQSGLDVPVSWLGGSSEDLEVGLSAKFRHKKETSYNASYPTLPNLSLAQASGGGPAYSFYDGQYMNPPDVLRGYVESLTGPGTAQPSDITSDQESYLDAKENVYAAFVQYHVQWDRLGVLGGVRVENTHENLEGYQFVTDALGNTAASLVTTTHSYTDAFPTIQVRYKIHPDLITRFSWSSTLARPGFNQLDPVTSIDLGSLVISTGNANLKPAFANSFDLDIEKYLPHAGILSLDLFDKEIKDYIVADNSGSIVHIPNISDPLHLYTYKNGGPAFARGVMLDYEQHLTFLPGLLSGLGVEANYTYVSSRFEIRPGEYARLPSSSQNTWNASVFYQRDGFLVRVAAYGVSADLFAIGSGPSSDVYNAKRTYLDLGSSYDLSRNWQVYFNAKNLLNTDHTFWQGSPDRPIQSEFYGPTYQAGFRFNY